MRDQLPGRDRRAIKIPAHRGTQKPTGHKKVVVVGGGIAGLAAAVGLAERGVHVTVVEPENELGGRVRAWNTENDAGNITMSRGFHAFFRQYYNLRGLLKRAGALEDLLVPLSDYPVVSVNGDRDSFAKIPRTPPWNFIKFVAQSPTFRAKDIAKVDIDAALSMLDVDFPSTYSTYDGESAAEFLDRLKFPDRARHLALEVFARSFFADPKEFSAGELVAMFHTYFLGSAEGLLFDVPRDDFDTSLWDPLAETLKKLGTTFLTNSVVSVSEVKSNKNNTWNVSLTDGTQLAADAVVLAAGPSATPQIITASPDLSGDWAEKQISGVKLAPPFAVLRIWTDKSVNADRPPFLGTAGFGPLDNISLLERFELGAKQWAQKHGGSVIELHAYAVPENELVNGDSAALREQLIAELERVYPETKDCKFIAEEMLVEQDCGLIGTGPWVDRPTVHTPFSGLVIAGDWVRCNLPIALMERAATTGWMAANNLLNLWGVAGHDLWSVPIASRHKWPRGLRNLMKKRPKRG